MRYFGVMEHLGKKIILSIAQSPFEHTGESGATNVFATLVPLISASGELLDQLEFPDRGLVFWMVRGAAERYTNPGRLIAGRLESAVRKDRDHYQLAPDSVDVASPSDLIEILDFDSVALRVVRDLVNTDNTLILDHPPTPLVLVRWRGDIYGPFKTETAPGQTGGWTVNLRTHRNDQMVFKFPEERLSDSNTFSPYHHRLSARISFSSREPSSSSPLCSYEVLTGAGFRRLPSLGFELISVESDKELLLRYARRFTNRKHLQQLRELLTAIEPDLGPTIEASDSERGVLESITRRSGQLDSELRDLSQALVASGLLEDQIESAVKTRAQEYVAQQSAELSAEIALNIDSQRIELDRLRRSRDTLNDELEAKHRQAQEEIEIRRLEFEQWILRKESALDERAQEVDSQRAKVAHQLESVVNRYEQTGTAIVEQFFTMLPLLNKFSLHTGSSEGPLETVRAGATNNRQDFYYPDFVLSSRGTTAPHLDEIDFFNRFEKHTIQSGFGYRKIDLLTFHLSVKCGDITILGGMSGTGKSTLPVLYAEALAGATGTLDRFLQVDVNPSWLSLQDLLGGVNSLERSFEPSASGLYRQLLIAQEEERRHQQESGIYIVSLDEMNLAHVEHYFSGFLQALEGNRKVPVFDAASVNPASMFASHGKLEIPAAIRFVGTVNFDETTRQLSMRLLDRANLIRLRPSDALSYGASPAHPRPTVAGPTVTNRHLREWRSESALSKEVAVVWDKIQKQLVILGVPVTPRRRRAIEGFIASANQLVPPMQAFDLQIAQRLIPQVRGTYRPEVQNGLEEMERILSQNAGAFPETLAAIEDLRRSEEGALGFVPSA